MSEPELPEDLFAAYRALKESDAPREAWDALSKRTRAAKAAWTQRGDTTRRQQLTDLAGYLSRARPTTSEVLTAATLAAAVDALRTRRGDVSATVRALLRRIEATRNARRDEPGYDEDHDELVDGEERLGDLARERGIDLDD